MEDTVINLADEEQLLELMLHIIRLMEEMVVYGAEEEVDSIHMVYGVLMGVMEVIIVLLRKMVQIHEVIHLYHLILEVME